MNNIKKIEDPFEILGMLASVGRKTRDVTVTEDFKIILETLNVESETLVFANTAKYEGSEYFTKHKIETLAFSMSAINGKSLREYDKIENLEERGKAREIVVNRIRSIVGTWDDNVISYVYSEFAALVSENEADMVKKGILKEIPKTETTEKK